MTIDNTGDNGFNVLDLYSLNLKQNLKFLNIRNVFEEPRGLNKQRNIVKRSDPDTIIHVCSFLNHDTDDYV